MRFRECGEVFLAWKMIFVEDERKSVKDLCKIGNAIPKQRNMVFGKKEKRNNYEELKEL